MNARRSNDFSIIMMTLMMTMHFNLPLPFVRSHYGNGNAVMRDGRETKDPTIRSYYVENYRRETRRCHANI